jgi:hypothetical protein
MFVKHKLNGSVIMEYRIPLFEQVLINSLFQIDINSFLPSSLSSHLLEGGLG